MHVQIHNKTTRLVSIALNSREMLHLPPRAVSRTLDPAEVDGNAKVKKLCDASIIAVESPGTGGGKRKVSNKDSDAGKSGPRRRNKK